MKIFLMNIKGPNKITKKLIKFLITSFGKDPTRRIVNMGRSEHLGINLKLPNQI